MRAFAAAALGALLLAGCGRQVSLDYAPTAPFATQQGPAIGGVNVTDARGEADPTWIGAVRGGFGNPLKVLHTPRPLADMVAAAVRDALARRGLYAAGANGPADLAVTIRRFESIQYVRREANVDLAIELRDHASGRVLYADEVTANPVEGSLLAFDVGIFGSSDDLQSVAQGALNRAIDTALNKPAFLETLRRGA